MDLTFTTTMIDDRTSIRPSHFMMGGTPGGPMMANSDFDRLMEAKDEEILTLKNKIEIQLVELQGKDGIVEQLKDENEQLQEKNKKWIGKLNAEIERNNA